MSTFDPGSESRGWPFADCAIHVQFRGEDNRRFSVDEIRQTCDDFGRIIKVYVWTAKRSQKPQACVLFDSMEAVKAAERSTHSGMYRLWKNGYHLLRMCESTTMILETCLKKDGLIQGHPIFASIPTRRAFYQVHPPVRGSKPVEKVHRPIPTGPRYQPYSLDARAHPPHSPPRAIPPEASFVSFPPKREATSPNGPAVPRHVKPALFSPRQPNHSSVPPAATQAAPSSPSKPFPRPKTPEPVGPSQTNQVEEVEQTQVKPKLKPEIQNSVSTQIESMTAKMQETEAENQRLKARLRNSEEDLALLEDTVKRVEGREQAAIALLTETETRSQEQLQSLRDSFKAVQSVKVKTEAELEALKRKYGVLEAQLLSTQEQLRLFSLSKRSDDRSIRAHSDSPRPGPETDKASSAEHDDDCITPATAAEFVRNPGSAKGTLQNLAGLLDAFKEIDDLVRSAFHE